MVQVLVKHALVRPQNASSRLAKCTEEVKTSGQALDHATIRMAAVQPLGASLGLCEDRSGMKPTMEESRRWRLALGLHGHCLDTQRVSATQIRFWSDSPASLARIGSPTRAPGHG